MYKRMCGNFLMVLTVPLSVGWLINTFCDDGYKRIVIEEGFLSGFIDFVQGGITIALIFTAGWCLRQIGINSKPSPKKYESHTGEV
jgi:hypothetical protein